MNIKMLKAAFAGLVLSVSGFANAGLISFDALTEVYDENNLGANISVSPYFLTYTEAGFIITLSSSPLSPQIGDAGATETFNWKSSFPTIVTLERVGGGLFNLHDFSYISSGLTVSAVSDYSYSPQLLTTSGTHLVNYTNVTSVNFTSSTDYNIGTGFAVLNHTLDNLNVSVSSVPEPSTLAIFALGIMGLVARRFKKQ